MIFKKNVKVFPVPDGKITQETYLLYSITQKFDQLESLLPYTPFIYILGEHILKSCTVLRRKSKLHSPSQMGKMPPKIFK
jgi:hypothetical protein